jgi:DNA-binding CsgD family transcriptional regulator
MPLVGRAADLQTLAEEHAAATGHLRLVVIEGAAGIGKSALVWSFVERLEVPVLSAVADEDESWLPYGVVEQLVAGVDAMADMASALRRDRAADPFAVGARLLDLLAPESPAAANGPPVVLVDDAHWADVPSLRALTFALRRLQGEPLLTIVATRDRAALPAGLLQLAIGGRGRILPLAGLRPDALAELAAAVGREGLPRATVRQLHAHTAGHPLHATALLEELPAEVLRQPGATLPAPRSFAMLVLGRLFRCSPDARALVTTAAVLGSGCSVGVVGRVAGLPDPLVALDEARDAGLLETRLGAPPLVDFPHPLIRSAVYHDLSHQQRTMLHERAAAMLEGPAALDHRVAAAPGEDTSLSAALERDGDARSAGGSPAAAAARYLAAARFTADRPRRDRLVATAATVLLDAGSMAEAVPLGPSVAEMEPGPWRSYLLGHMALVEGRVDDAAAALHEAWDARGDDPALAARIAGQLAQLESLRNQPDLGIAWARRVLDTGVEPAAAPALSVIIGNLAALGRAEEAFAVAAELPPGPASPTELEVRLGRGLARLWTGDSAGARQDLADVVRASRSSPTSRAAMIALGYLAETEFRLGQWDDSVAHGDLVVSLAVDSDQEWLVGFAHAHASWALAARGDVDRAANHVARAQERGEPWALGCTATAAAHLAFCRHDPAGVVAAVQPIMSLDRRGALDEPGIHGWREPLVTALTALGRLDEAERVLSDLAERSVARGHRLCLVSVGRLRGTLEAVRGRSDRAREAFEAAVAAAAEVDAPFEQALLDEAYGRVLRRAGERRAAMERLRACRDAFARLGAVPFVERMEPELAACGLGPAIRAVRGPSDLTPQELAVARLVVRGLTNREVATELIVSVKTVEYHLANVFAKLGVRSRRELGRLPGPPGPGFQD